MHQKANSQRVPKSHESKINDCELFITIALSDQPHTQVFNVRHAKKKKTKQKKTELIKTYHMSSDIAGGMDLTCST